MRALRASNREVEKRAGISAAQLFVLRQLETEPGLSLVDLADRTLTHQSTVSEVVSRLVDAGLVVRGASAGDARRAEVVITARGQALCRRAPDPMQSVLFSALRQLPASKRSALAEGLEAWVTAAHLADLPPTMLFEPGRRRRSGLLEWRKSRRHGG